MPHLEPDDNIKIRYTYHVVRDTAISYALKNWYYDQLNNYLSEIGCTLKELVLSYQIPINQFDRKILNFCSMALPLSLSTIWHS